MLGTVAGVPALDPECRHYCHCHSVPRNWMTQVVNPLEGLFLVAVCSAEK